jgi:uncharacterized protein (TIGR02001 family)
MRLRSHASDGIDRAALMCVALLRRGRRTLVVLSLSTGTLAQAQWSATVAADSDYRFRGVSLSESGPTLRVAVNYDAPNACYAGGSATRVELAHGDRYAQLLGYGGCVIAAIDGRHVEVGATYSHFTGDSSYDFAEAYVGVLAERWSARVHFAPDYFGRRVSTVYAELDTHLLLDADFRLFGHVGAVARIAGRDEAASRTRIDVRLGAGWVLRDLDLQIAWVAASRGGPFPAVYGSRRSDWVARASYSF